MLHVWRVSLNLHPEEQWCLKEYLGGVQNSINGAVPQKRVTCACCTGTDAVFLRKKLLGSYMTHYFWVFRFLSCMSRKAKCRKVVFGQEHSLWFLREDYKCLQASADCLRTWNSLLLRKSGQFTQIRDTVVGGTLNLLNNFFNGTADEPALLPYFSYSERYIFHNLWFSIAVNCHSTVGNRANAISRSMSQQRFCDDIVWTTKQITTAWTFLWLYYEIILAQDLGRGQGSCCSGPNLWKRKQKMVAHWNFPVYFHSCVVTDNGM